MLACGCERGARSGVDQQIVSRPDAYRCRKQCQPPRVFGTEAGTVVDLLPRPGQAGVQNAIVLAGPRDQTIRTGAGCPDEKLQVEQLPVPIALEGGSGSIRQSRGRCHPAVASDEESGWKHRIEC